MELTEKDVGKEYLIIKKCVHSLIGDTSKIGDVVIAYQWTESMQVMKFKPVKEQKEDTAFYLHPFTELKAATEKSYNLTLKWEYTK